MKKPTLSKRAIRRKVDEFVGRLKDRPKKETREEKPEAKSKSLSHEKPASRHAIRYQPHRAKGARFRDVRGVENVVEPSGAVRAVGKPRSKVKREREVSKELAAASKSRRDRDPR